MPKNSRTFLLCLVAVAMTSATAQAATTTLYEEDFSLGFAALSGYGWIADTTGGQTSEVKVAPGSWADQPGWGIQGDLAAGVEHWTHTFDTAIPAGATTVTATAKAYVRWGGDPSGWATRGDNGFGFRSDPGALDAGLSYDGTSGGTGGWKLFVDGVGSVLMYPNHYNGTNNGADVMTGIPIEITLDLVNDTITATVNATVDPTWAPTGPSTKTISTGSPGSATILAGRVHYHTDMVNSSQLGGLDLDTILVTADTGLAGDFDMDDDVDGEDFLLWQRDMGVGDLADWEANYGTATLAVAATSAVPEPTSGLLLAFGVVALSTAIRRKVNSLGRFTR